MNEKERVLISFLSGGDAGCSSKLITGQIYRIIDEYKITKLMLFYTTTKDDRLCKKDERIEEYQHELGDANVILKTLDLTDSDTNNYQKINEIFINKGYYKAIEDFCVNKEVYVNVSSGRQAMIDTLFGLVLTGKINTQNTVYVPEPWDKNLKPEISTFKQEFYRRAYNYNTLKMFIEKYDYTAIHHFIENQENKIGEDFKTLANFAYYRSINNFKCADHCYKKLSEKNKKFYYETVKDDFYKLALEFYYCCVIAFNQNNNYEGIVRGRTCYEILYKKLLQPEGKNFSNTYWKTVLEIRNRVVHEGTYEELPNIILWLRDDLKETATTLSISQPKNFEEGSELKTPYDDINEVLLKELDEWFKKG